MTSILKSRWLAVTVHAGLWALVLLALRNLDGARPSFREALASTPPQRSIVPVSGIERLYARGFAPALPNETNLTNPFFTKHFIPAPTPAPPAPTTRKIQLIYHGFYEAGEGPKRAVVKMGDAFLVAPIGSRLTANLYAAQASMVSLVLTNPQAVTNVLPLNTSREIEVPIK